MDDETAFRFLAECTVEDFFKAICQKDSKHSSILRRIFSFRTVCYTTNDTYLCCPCAFQHEFCDYARVSGETNRDVVESLVCSISNRHCPHAFGQISLKTTSVSGFTIASARGVEFIEKLLNLEIHRFPTCEHPESVFGVDVNVRKDSLQERVKIEAFCRRFFKIDNPNFGIVFTHDFRLICAVRQSSETQSNYIKLEYISPLEYCVRNGNVELTKVFSNHDLLQHDIERAMQLTFRQNPEVK